MSNFHVMPWRELRALFDRVGRAMEARACEACVDAVGLRDQFIGETMPGSDLCKGCTEMLT